MTIPSGSSTASFKYVDTLAGSPTLTAAATGLTSATQTEMVVGLPGPANWRSASSRRLPWPGYVSPAVTVKVEDQFGNVETDNSSNLTLSINTGPGVIASGGTATVTGGVGTFRALTLDTSGSYTLGASDMSNT